MEILADGVMPSGRKHGCTDAQKEARMHGCTQEVNGALFSKF